MVLRSYLAVGQKHLKECRVPTLQISKSPVGWDLFPVLLPQFQPRQPRTSTGYGLLLPSRICMLRGPKPFCPMVLVLLFTPGADSQKCPCPALLSSIHGALESPCCHLCSDPHPQLQFHTEVGTVWRKQMDTAVEMEVHCLDGSFQPIPAFLHPMGAGHIPSDGSGNPGAFPALCALFFSPCCAFLWKQRDVCIPV